MRAALVLLASLVALGCQTAELPPLPDAKSDVTSDARDASDSADATSATDADDVADVDAGEDTTSAPGWHEMMSGFSEALHAIWGSGPNDVWLVGDDGLVVHGGPDGWRQVDLASVDGSGAPLRGVFGPDADHVWFVGEAGRAFRWSRAAASAEAIATATEASLYRLWGASEDALWAVGGGLARQGGPAVIVKLGPGGGELVTLPALPDGPQANAALLDIWGAGPDDVWAVGEHGLALHWTGSAWQAIPVGSDSRLAAVTGRKGVEVLVAGGAAGAQIFELPASSSFWMTATLDAAPALRGIEVGADGAAWAVGSLGQMFERPAGAVGATPAWISHPSGAGTTWRDVWIDPRGDVWVAGDGRLLRYGPERSDVPTGSLQRVVVPDPEAVEQVADVEVVESEVSEVVEADGEVAGDVVPVEDWPFQLGLAPVDNAFGFVPFMNGQTVPITHGPQGGFHVEMMVRFPWTGNESTVLAGVKLALIIDGQQKALYETTGYPLPLLGNGIYQSYVIAVQWECVFTAEACQSSQFDGKTAALTATITPPGKSWSGSLDVMLDDTW